MLRLEKMDAGDVDNLVNFEGTALRLLPDPGKWLLHLPPPQQLLQLPLPRIVAATSTTQDQGTTSS